MIEFIQVSKAYRGIGTNALTGLNLKVEKGQFVAVLGSSGAGKSTLFKLIAAIEQPSAGQVRVGGQDISRLTPRAVPFLRRNIGLTFQDQKLLFDRSVLDNVVLPLLYLGTPHKEAQSRARAALDKVGIREKERLFPAMLSGGEQQRVAIARAIVGRPAILLADEPTANLDEKTAQRIVDIFADFQRIGVTVMIATHDPELLRGKATRAITLGAGQLVSDTDLSLTQGGA
jgi:cell division transport system ATP-binding protein